MFRRLSLLAVGAIGAGAVVVAVAVAPPTQNVSAAPVVVYDSIGPSTPQSVGSYGLFANTAGQFGDLVQLAPGLVNSTRSQS